MVPCLSKAAVSSVRNSAEAAPVNTCSRNARCASGEGGSGNTLWRNSCHKAREAEAQQGKARATQDTELESAESKAATYIPE